MTRQVLPSQVVLKDLIVEEKLFAEITPRVRQNLGSFVGRRVSVLDVAPERFKVVDPLLSDKNSATLEANLAECLLVHTFKMSPQTFHVGEHLRCRAVVHQALQ